MSAVVRIAGITMTCAYSFSHGGFKQTPALTTTLLVSEGGARAPRSGAEDWIGLDSFDDSRTPIFTVTLGLLTVTLGLLTVTLGL